MRTLTCSRTSIDGSAAIIAIANERGHVASVKRFGDGSHTTVSGFSWLLDAAKRDLGKLPVKAALQRAAETGYAYAGEQPAQDVCGADVGLDA